MSFRSRPQKNDFCHPQDCSVIEAKVVCAEQLKLKKLCPVSCLEPGDQVVLQRMLPEQEDACCRELPSLKGTTIEALTAWICENCIDVGPQGPQGFDGEDGPQGNQGPKGTDGTQGGGGSKGCQGPQGCEGRDACDGEDGKEGPQGPQGQDGCDKKDGSQGELGPQGYEGHQGPQGCQGKRGYGASNGCQGPQGTSPCGICPQGFQGRDGLTVGPQGFVGELGEQGQQGTRGETGLPGIDGPQAACCPCPCTTKGQFEVQLQTIVVEGQAQVIAVIDEYCWVLEQECDKVAFRITFRPNQSAGGLAWWNLAASSPSSAVRIGTLFSVSLPTDNCTIPVTVVAARLTDPAYIDIGNLTVDSMGAVVLHLYRNIVAERIAAISGSLSWIA